MNPPWILTIKFLYQTVFWIRIWWEAKKSVEDVGMSGNISSFLKDRIKMTTTISRLLLMTVVRFLPWIIMDDESTFHEICNWWVHQSFLISEKSYLNNSNRIFRFTISANEASISWKRAIALISESEKCHLNKRLAFFFVHKLSILDTDDVWYRKQEKFFQLQRGKFFWY